MTKEIKIKCKAADGLAIDELYEFQGELKTISDDELERLKKSILKYGFSFPVFVWKNKILDGHQRLKAVKKLIEQGYKIKGNELPVVRIEAKNEKEAAEKLLLINSRYAKIDQEGFQVFTYDYKIDLGEMTELIELPEIDLSINDNEDYQGLTDPDEVPEVEETPVSNTGDIWLLGDHRLMCGDSTNEDEIYNLMKNSLADLMVTDPPYGVAYIGKTKNKLTIESDDIDLIKLKEFISAWFDNAYKFTRDGSYWIATVPARPLHEIFIHDWNKRGILRQIMVWVKDSMVLGHSEYHYRHEPILFGWKKGDRLKNNDRTKTTVWEFERPKRSTEHPTMKPVNMWIYAIKNHSNKDDILYEPFSGSGTTIIAAEQTKRRCFAMEISPHYVDVAVKRWQDFTGEDAVLESDNKKFNNISKLVAEVAE